MSKQDYDFTDLVLLIGTNPLPNYVVAKYLSDNCDSLSRIWMLHSKGNNSMEGTGYIASLLEEVLRRNISKEIIFNRQEIEYVGSDDSIKSAVNNLIKRINAKSGINKINLNYTGGTKAMSVHTYRIFEKTANLNVAFSYLDARDYQLKYDNKKHPSTGDLKEKVSINAWDLLNLHGDIRKGFETKRNDEKEKAREAELQKDPLCGFLTDEKIIADRVSEDKVKKLLQEYGKIFENNDGLKKYNKYIDQKIDDYKKLLWKCIYSLDNTEIEKFWKECNADLKAVLKVIPNSPVDWLPGENDSLKEISHKIHFMETKFLKGTLFELYVANCIREMAEEKREAGWKATMEIKVGWEIVKNTNNKANPYEVDIIFMNGYQVCVISCTVSSGIDTAKKKALEVLHRAQQLGGEEARAILITQLTDEENNEGGTTYNLEDGLRSFTEASSERFCIIGPGDFKQENLNKKIGKFLWIDGR